MAPLKNYQTVRPRSLSARRRSATLPARKKNIASCSAPCCASSTPGSARSAV